ncbi:MAG: hypothetical protein WC977_08965 [Anaerovoracaceae bacterium]
MPHIALPNPHPGQAHIRTNARRFNFLAAGRRWRKTTLFMTVAVEGAAEGQTWMWGAPTFDQVRVGWDEARRAVGRYATFTQQRMMAEFPGGGRIIYRSLDDPDNARGHTADGLVIDEAADVKEAAWYEVLRPMLIDTNGAAWVGGTPKGRNWFWREHENARDRADSRAWQAPTLGVRIGATGLMRDPHPLENPFIPLEEVDNLWRTMPERVFRQEILAEFIDDTGGVFRRVMDAATLQPQEPIKGRQYVMGVDWAKSADFTVLTVMDVAAHELVYLDRFNQIDYVVQRARLGALAARYNPSAIIAESNSIGEPIIEQLQRDGLPVTGFQTTNATKAAIIEALALAFEQGSIKILNDPVLIGELQAYEMARLPSGMTRYGAPEGLHDDTVMSLALAWSAVADSGPLLLWGDS